MQFHNFKRFLARNKTQVLVINLAAIGIIIYLLDPEVGIPIFIVFGFIVAVITIVDRMNLKKDLNSEFIFPHASVIEEKRFFKLEINRQEKKVKIVSPLIENTFRPSTKYKKPELSINDSPNKYNHKIFYELITLQDEITIKYAGNAFVVPVQILPGLIKINFMIKNNGEKTSHIKLNEISLRVQNKLLQVDETNPVGYPIEITAGKTMNLVVEFRIYQRIKRIIHAQLIVNSSKLNDSGYSTKWSTNP